MTWFEDMAGRARLLVARPGGTGLRLAQLGAAWGTAAQFASWRRHLERSRATSLFHRSASRRSARHWLINRPATVTAAPMM